MTSIDTAWNAPEHLPPVGCPLLIKMPYDQTVRVTRTGYIESKNREMEYKREDTGEIVVGKFPWTYP